MTATEGVFLARRERAGARVSGQDGAPGRSPAAWAMPALFAIGLSAMLPGCAQVDPYKREGMWQPVGANARNLAAMLDRPTDLVRGRGTHGFPAIEASPPVVGYWSGRVATLPNSSSQSSSTGPAAAPPPASSNGGGT